MINLTDYSTKAPKDLKKNMTKAKFKLLAEEIAELQHTMYAEQKHSLLVIFQGMDASGKDGSTKNVFRQCSPIGVEVKGFKKPTEEEFAHDFLWRVHKEAPQKGMVKIFNRSHYEDILIQRVHGWISEERVRQRMESINAFERLLAYDNNTTIIKCYLHISEGRQKEKLQERIDLPEKHWKHNSGDWKERKLWDKYMAAYHDVLNHCNDIPWHIIPADQRWYRNYTVAKIVLKTLKEMNPQLPTKTKEELAIE